MACVSFTVNKASDNSVVFSGAVSGPVSSPDTGEPAIYTADFSSVTQPGSYYLAVAGVGQSVVFPVGIDVYNNAYYMAMKGFYLWRCGTAVSYYYPKDGNTYSHAACHLQDAFLDYRGGGHVIQDETQGWHNAGDYGKYAFDAGATGQMFDAWFMNKNNIIPMPLDIPETAPGLPDFLKEMKWQTDWMLKMLDQNNMASFKVSTHDMPGYVMPEADTADRYLAPSGSPETALLTATLAMAARAYQPYSPAFASQCLNAAASSYAYLTANPVEVIADLSAYGGTGLENEDINSLRLWAAAEMWETTGDAAALADFETRAAAYAPTYVDSDFDWEVLKYMGMFTYVLSTRPGRDAVLLANIKNNIVQAADAVVNTRNNNAYGRPLGDTYYWGCNGTVARQAMLLQVANHITPKQGYMDTILDAIGYLYGRNMHDRSYITGVGINPPMNPHHRPSAADGIVNPWPGYLVGGSPGSNGPGYDWVVGSMAAGLPPAQYWVDSTDAYSANEVCNNWQSGLVFALAGFVLPETPTFTATATPTITGTPPTPTMTCTSTPQLTPNSVYADCAQGPAFVIDGNLNDPGWQTGTWINVTRATAGAAGIVSFRFKLRWDITALYVAVDVTDPVLCNSNANWWEDDDVEVYIDANNDHATTYAADDFEFTKRYGDPVTHEAHGKLGSATAATYQTASGYSVEFMLPWTVIGKTPSPGLVMGFDISVDHNETCGPTSDGVICWNGNLNNYLDTSGFGEAYINGCGTPTNTPTCTPTATATSSPTYTPTPTYTTTSTPASTVTFTPTQTITTTPLNLTVSVPASDADIQYSGRIDFTNPNAPRFDWPGVSILAVFQGSSIGILLTDGNNNYNVFIDGALNNVIATTAATEYDITGLTSGTHTLLLSKRTEGNFGTAVFNGLKLETGASLLTPPAKPTRRVEFCGDSYTCAYGVESPQLTCNAAQLRQYENNWIDYSEITARALCAEFHITAYSGRGIVHNYGDTNPLSADPLPYYYPRTLVNSVSPLFNYSSWVPDAVVIFLGTNDFSAGNIPTKLQYETGYKNFIATIRGAYPLAKIICVSFSTNTMMKTDVQDVVSQENVSGDANVVYGELSDIGAQFTGCDYHPSVAGQQHMATDMQAILESNMGWLGCGAASPTATPTPGQPTPTPTIQPQSATLEITGARPYPNPFNPSRQTSLGVGFNITRDCSGIKFRLYTTGFRLIRETEYQGTYYAGDNILQVDTESMKNLASGIYYYVLIATAQGKPDHASSEGELIVVKDK
jgi:endoglucanase